MNLTPQDLITGRCELPSLPEIYQKISQVAAEPYSSAEDLARLVATDPSLSTRLLGLVNSAFYNFPMPIESLGHAVTLLGLSKLRQLVLATSIVQSFSTLLNPLIDMRTFWSQSLSSALLARHFATQNGASMLRDELFTAALIRDIGSLVLYYRLPELARAALLQAEQEAIAPVEAERAVLGFDHTDISHAIAQRWHLSGRQRTTMAYHHWPGEAKEYSHEVWLIHLADKINTHAPRSWDADSIRRQLPPDIWRQAAVDPTVLEEVVSSASQEYEEALRFILG